MQVALLKEPSPSLILLAHRRYRCVNNPSIFTLESRRVYQVAFTVTKSDKESNVVSVGFLA